MSRVLLFVSLAVMATSTMADDLGRLSANPFGTGWRIEAGADGNQPGTPERSTSHAWDDPAGDADAGDEESP